MSPKGSYAINAIVTVMDIFALNFAHVELTRFVMSQLGTITIDDTS
jgi:hypothetical protein